MKLNLYFLLSFAFITSACMKNVDNSNKKELILGSGIHSFSDDYNNAKQKVDPAYNTYLEDEINFEQLKVGIHNYCTPMLDVCQSIVKITYENQTIEKYLNDPRKITKEDIRKSADLLTIFTGNGGNCIGCFGYQVFKVIEGKIRYIGFFQEVDGIYLTINFQIFNDFTSNALIPGWLLYYSIHDDKIILDFNKTCTATKEKYQDGKNSISLDGFNKVKIKLDGNNTENHDEEFSKILFILGLSKWCGWGEEYNNIVSLVKNSYEIDYEAIIKINKALVDIKKQDDNLAWKNWNSSLDWD